MNVMRSLPPLCATKTSFSLSRRLRTGVRDPVRDHQGPFAVFKIRASQQFLCLDPFNHLVPGNKCCLRSTRYLKDHVRFVAPSPNKPQDGARDGIVLHPAGVASSRPPAPSVERPIHAADISPCEVRVRCSATCTAVNDKQRPCVSDPSVVLFDYHNANTSAV